MRKRAFFALIGIGKDPVGWMARGFALGTLAHGIGAARALQVNADAGAGAAGGDGFAADPVRCAVVEAVENLCVLNF